MIFSQNFTQSKISDAKCMFDERSHKSTSKTKEMYDDAKEQWGEMSDFAPFKSAYYKVVEEAGNGLLYVPTKDIAGDLEKGKPVPPVSPSCGFKYPAGTVS